MRERTEWQLFRKPKGCDMPYVEFGQAYSSQKMAVGRATAYSKTSYQYDYRVVERVISSEKVVLEIKQ